MGSQEYTKVLVFFFFGLLSYLVFSQIWLNHLMDDDCHFSYITKLGKTLNPKRSLPTWEDRYKPSVTSTPYVLVTNVDRQRDAHCAHEWATTYLHLFAIFANTNFLRLVSISSCRCWFICFETRQKKNWRFFCLFVCLCVCVCACVRDSTRRSEEIPLIENRHVATSAAASEGGRRVEWSRTAQHSATS